MLLGILRVLGTEPSLLDEQEALLITSHVFRPYRTFKLATSQAGEMLSRSEHLLFFQRTRFWFPALARRLTTF